MQCDLLLILLYTYLLIIPDKSRINCLPQHDMKHQWERERAHWIGTHNIILIYYVCIPYKHLFASLVPRLCRKPGYIVPRLCGKPGYEAKYSLHGERLRVCCQYSHECITMRHQTYIHSCTLYHAISQLGYAINAAHEEACSHVQCGLTIAVQRIQLFGG